MDPDAALTRFEAALADGEFGEADQASLDLLSWCRSGGFLPFGYRTLAGLADHLSRRARQARTIRRMEAAFA